MSLRFLSDSIVFLDHKVTVDKQYSCYPVFNSENKKVTLKPELFDIRAPYEKKLYHEEQRIDAPKSKRRKKGELNFDEVTLKDNRQALEFVDAFNRQDQYDRSSSFKGANLSEYSVINSFAGQDYVIPSNCHFFNDDIARLNELVPEENKFDYIVLDPPWWNKYIRRTKPVNKNISYQMLDNEAISNIPLEKYIHSRTVVVIWCTNSPTHINAIKEKFCKKWKLKLVGNWYWIKTTKSGLPVCAFNEVTKKQPYEQLFIATSENGDSTDMLQEKFIFSIPCAFHSNKPPLIDLFAELLPEHPKCLELFARNVYPNFTSIGTEVLKLQNARLFNFEVCHK
ncbi:N(6)-adenine-specific methyltransferase METTL4 isoform X2 [Uranotaenia lowii]|uniref:N(6)-adenine-specific methyltransferase METTL4 isoform X2 n=1 Tax=Uranotaenia lowii TaxID=190385 RepID=UPI0024786C51|nr:N(6)-adenine-specific methyltransferase METTL4 isoform X2 [Uranotaenia lowii]